MATIISMHTNENIDADGSKKMARVFTWMVDGNHIRMIKYLGNSRISDETLKLVFNEE